MTKLEKNISMRHPSNDEMDSNLPREEFVLAMEDLKKKKVETWVPMKPFL